jgi:large subunit ribosomal protein L24
MKRIIKGDKVIVTTGRSKGHIGVVSKVLDQYVLIDGANLIHKAVKPNPNIQEKGGIKTLESPLHSSNVALYDPNSKKRSKVAFRFQEKDGKKIKVRYYKQSNNIVETRGEVND